MSSEKSSPTHATSTADPVGCFQAESQSSLGRNKQCKLCLPFLLLNAHPLSRGCSLSLGLGSCVRRKCPDGVIAVFTEIVLQILNAGVWCHCELYTVPN